MQEKEQKPTEQQTRVAMIGIVVSEPASVERLNGLLHDYSRYIIGRMGLPYRERGMNLISIMMDGPQEQISALSGKIGMLPGVSSKVIYSRQ
ncbi:MAG: iron-only hydrogenase system regulator [Lachnospiraceae bacterium]|nr:iron-only hydrogenase system regulator [Lachnospiraceae bacterium]